MHNNFDLYIADKNYQNLQLCKKIMQKNNMLRLNPDLKSIFETQKIFLATLLQLLKNSVVTNTNNQFDKQTLEFAKTVN